MIVVRWTTAVVIVDKPRWFQFYFLLGKNLQMFTLLCIDAFMAETGCRCKMWSADWFCFGFCFFMNGRMVRHLKCCHCKALWSPAFLCIIPLPFVRGGPVYLDRKGNTETLLSLRHLYFRAVFCIVSPLTSNVPPSHEPLKANSRSRGVR